MDARKGAELLLSFAFTFLPIYLVERLANYYYLIDLPAVFFVISGLRLPLFVLFALSGSIGSGLLLRDLRLAIASQVLALGSLLAVFYALCSSPRVCYSVGPDGLEPLRLGLMLGSLCVLGACIGHAPRAGSPGSYWPDVLGSLSSFILLLFFPVVYTFAGARFYPLLYPWVLMVLVSLLTLYTCTTLAARLGPRLGDSLPLLSAGAVFLLAAPLAAAYLPQIAWSATLLALSVLAGAVSSIVVNAVVPGFSKRRGVRVVPAFILVVLILGSFWVIPDEVNGLVPQVGAAGFVAGSPVYVGGFMDAPTTPAQGIAATVSFAGTNSSSIQSDNFLSAGIGAHSPDCCVDGIDYGYRFDLYLFHDGSESLLASAWQVCDDNTACGGHSWKYLMFSRGATPAGGGVSKEVYLEIQWVHHSAIWSYRVGSGSLVQFANFTAPAKENPAFNVGLVDLSSPFSTQQDALFYQFGIMSSYPIGHGGWSVTFSCPGTLQNHTWGCVQHARVAEGGFSFWKVLWRWGEDYPHVMAEGDGKTYFTFSYSPSSTVPNLAPLLS